MDNRRPVGADQDDFDTGPLEPDQTKAVVDIKPLHRLAFVGKVKPTVSECSVHVQQQ